MITRQKKYLREIIANYFGVSEKELCELGEISEKTLKSDLLTLQKTLKKYGLALRIEEDRVFIPFKQKEDFLNVYEEIISEDERQVLASEAKERKMFILTYLTWTDGYISMNILADALYVSKSSIASLVHELKEEIPKLLPSVSLSVSGRKGIRIHAGEADMRELLVQAFSKEGGLVMENPYFLNFLEKELREKLSQVVALTQEFLSEHHVVMTNANISKLIMHTMIIIQRTGHGYFLEANDIREDGIYEEYAKALEKVGFYISGQELSSLPLRSLNRLVIENPLSEQIIQEFIQTINREYQTEILREEEAEQLTAHLDELLKKGFQGTELKEFMFDQMLQRLLSAYILCGRLCELIYQYTGIMPDEENRSYMAMHVQSLYRRHIMIQENIMLYESNISRCNMIKTDLEKHFGAKATITPVYVRWDIEKWLSETDFALILGTESVLGAFGEVPFLKIHPFLTDEDYDAIDFIVYKNRPVVTKPGIYRQEQEAMEYQGVQVPLDREILRINGVLLMSSVCEELETAIYEFTYRDAQRFFVFNYDLKEPFLIYNRLINRFGEMLKNNQI